MNGLVNQGVSSADPLDRYGLRLVDEPSPAKRDLDTRAEPRSVLSELSWFDYGMLVAFAALQLGHLCVLAMFARWALNKLIAA